MGAAETPANRRDFLLIGLFILVFSMDLTIGVLTAEDTSETVFKATERRVTLGVTGEK